MPNGNGNSIGLISTGYMLKIAQRHGYVEVLRSLINQDGSADFDFGDAIKTVADKSTTGNTMQSLVDSYLIGAVKSNARNMYIQTRNKRIYAI